MEEKDDLINQLINDGGVCRTAPATPGLLNIYILQYFQSCHIRIINRTNVSQHSTRKSLICEVRAQCIKNQKKNLKIRWKNALKQCNIGGSVLL